jgi:DUF1680 family protein
LSGVSLDGKRYFYVNPLELVPAVAACRRDHEHVQESRVQWNSCACCPPNIARFVASLPSYLYGSSEGILWVHQYAESEATTIVGGVRVRLTQKTDYPWSGSISLLVDPERESDFAVRLRIPDWCGDFACSVNGHPLPALKPAKGYIELRRLWRRGDLVELELRMEPRILRADPRIEELAGRLAIQRGPLVYCIESVDNGEGLHSLVLEAGSGLRAAFDSTLMGGSVVIEAEGYREGLVEGDSRSGEGERFAELPYAPAKPARLSPAVIRAVPYHQWGNRQPGGEMRVWLRSRT